MSIYRITIVGIIITSMFPQRLPSDVFVVALHAAIFGLVGCCRTVPTIVVELTQILCAMVLVSARAYTYHVDGVHKATHLADINLHLRYR